MGFLLRDNSYIFVPMIELLNTNFYDGFAKRTSEIVISANKVRQLCTLLEKCIISPQLLKEELILKEQITDGSIKKINSAFIEKIEFRAAFLIETIYLGKNKNMLDYFTPKIFSLLVHITNPSTKRHFGKIVCKELENAKLDNNPEFTDKDLLSITDIMQAWAVNPKAKPAVKIWAINSLFAIRELYLKQNNFHKNKINLHLLDSFLRDFIEYELVNPLPSMQVCLRVWINNL